MLSKRSSFKNQTCPVPDHKKTTPIEITTPLPHSPSTKFSPKSNDHFNHHEFDHDLQSNKLTQRTNSVGHRDYGLDSQPIILPRTQSTKFPATLDDPPHPLSRTQSKTKLVQKTNIFDHLGPKIELPVSADVVGEEITNANHPQHRMIHVNLPCPFTCMGCKEYGAGPRFTCQQCNFELHDFCALAPPVLKAQPLHSHHQLLFNPKPGKGGILRSKCDVCGKPTKGYIFHCNACSYQLHPCCEMLSPKMKFPIHAHPLVILPASTNSLLGGNPGELPCAECKRKRSGQIYRCTICDYYLHAVCAKNMINGLHANGIKGLDKPSVLGVAAKIATHVVVGFVGGLVEGLGEGLGEAITQNFVKGRCNSGRKLLYPGV